jgi:hypothetical protein
MSKESPALVAYGPISRGQWKLQPVIPRPIRSDEVLVRLVASGICRADIHFGDATTEGNSNPGIYYPRVLGHEGEFAAHSYFTCQGETLPILTVPKDLDLSKRLGAQ